MYARLAGRPRLGVSVPCAAPLGDHLVSTWFLGHVERPNVMRRLVAGMLQIWRGLSQFGF